MAQNNKPLYTLYESLKSDNYDVPEDYDSFESTLTAPGADGTKNRLTLYKSLKDDGYDVPDTYDSFANTLFAAKPRVVREQQAANAETESTGTTASKPAAPGTKADETGKVGLPDVANAADGDAALTPVGNTDPMTIATTFSEESRQMVGDMGRMLGAMTPDGRKKQQGLEIAGRMAGRNTRLPGLSVAMPAPEQPEASEGAQAAPKAQDMRGPQYYGTVVDQEDGQTKDQWLMPDGSLTTDFYEADVAAVEARSARLQREFERRMVINGLDTSKPEDVAAQQAYDQLAQLEARAKMHSDEKLAKLEERYEKAGAMERGRLLIGQNGNTATSMVTMPASVYGNGIYDDEDKLIAAERKNLEDAITAHHAGKLKKTGSFFAAQNIVNAWEGVKDVFKDGDTYTAGMTSMHQSAQMLAIKAKLDKGEALTRGEENLLESMLVKQTIDENIEKPHGYTMGYTIANMVPFMIQMAMNPAAGAGGKLGNMAVKEFAKMMAKRAGRRATQGFMMKAVAKLGKKRAAAIAKGIGVTAGDIVASAGLANTLQAPATMADAALRHVGDVAYDKDGTLHFEAGDGVVKAFYKAEMASLIENYTEMLGAHFGVIGGAIGRGTGKAVRKLGGGRLLDNVMKLCTNIQATDWAKGIAAIERRAQWNGSVGEVLEEEAGIALNSIFTGDNSISDLWDKEQQIDIVLGVGAFGAFVSGIKTAGYPIARHRARKALDERAATCEASFGKNWDSIRETIDMADEADLAQTIARLGRRYATTPERAKALLEYASAMAKARAFNIASASAEELQTTPEQRQIDQSYNNGYTAEGSGRADVQNLYNAQRERSLNTLDADTMRNLDADPLATLSGMASAGTYTEEELSAAREYAAAKSAYDGMQQSVEDEIEAQIGRCNAAIDARTNRDTGMVQRATYGQEDREVYIIKGNVVADENGVIDRSASDDTIAIVDLETGETKMVASKDLGHAEQPIAAEQFKSRMAAYVRQEIGDKARAQAEGRLLFEENEKCLILDDEGSQSEVTILGDATDEQGAPIADAVKVQYADGTTGIVAMSELQEQVNAAAAARMDYAEQERQQGAAARAAVDAEADTDAESERLVGEGGQRRSFALNDEVELIDDQGGVTSGTIIGEIDYDGLIEVQTDKPVNGQMVNRLTFDELMQRLTRHNGEIVDEGEVKGESEANGSNEPNSAEVDDGFIPIDPELIPTGGADVAEDSDAGTPEAPGTKADEADVSDVSDVTDVANVADVAAQSAGPTALERLPKNGKGEPIFENAESPEVGWDALVEFSDGDASAAKENADMMAEIKRKALEKVRKQKPKGDNPTAIRESQTAIAAALAKAEQEYDFWIKVASVEQERKAEERRREDEGARARARERAEAEKAEREAREEAARQEREALEGIPEWHLDTPEDARKRGARRYSGQMFTRQEPIDDNHPGFGREVNPLFKSGTKPISARGRIFIGDVYDFQPSHVDGQLNPRHFVPEVQPKRRHEDGGVSVMAAKTNAENFRPELALRFEDAFNGVPVVNSRMEVGQGNGRTQMYRYLYEMYPEKGAAFKQTLMDMADELGISPEYIASIEHPMPSMMLSDITDEDFIRLGNIDDKELTSGGIERIKPKNVAQKLGEDMRSFASQLLRSGDEEASFSQLVDRNGTEVMKWMAQKGAITNTQYQSAFDSKGNLTAEAKNDLQKVLYQAVFKGGSQQLEEMFDALPAKAQRAILSTAFRDMDSPFAGKMLPEIQASIAAYHQLMRDPAFAASKKLEGLLRAVETFKQVIELDDRFEQYAPADNFSNFALHLAAMYKASDMSQSTIAGYFNQMYDLAQGKKAATLFEEADTTEYPLADVIKKVLNIDYKPAKNGNNNVANGGADVALRNQDGQGGELRGNEPPAGGEQNPTGTEPTDRGAGTASDSGQRNDVEPVGYGDFGPIFTQFKGNAKGAIEKLVELKCGEAIGALHHSDVGDIDLVWGIEGTGHSDGMGLAKLVKYHPEVVERLQEILDDMVVVKRTDNRINLESETHKAAIRLTWNNEAKKWLLTAFEKKETPKSIDKTTDTGDNPTDLRGDTALSQNSGVSDGKVNTSAADKQESGAVSSVQRSDREGTQTVQAAVQAASAQVNTAPSEAQKKAGNYRKGHVKIAGFDISIENPAGSERSGVDANKKVWKTTMANTYGYIKGTEGVDGDHIDVFLANDMDAWDGRKVFVVDQTNLGGGFDEHKVMLGFNDKDEAMTAYLANYDKTWADTHPGLRISETTLDDFKKWVVSSHRKGKPFAEYKSVDADTTEVSAAARIEGAEKLSAERAEAVERYAEGHYCVPIRVIADEADIRESGLSDVAVAQMMAALTEEDVPAVYCREDKKIYIFAGHKDSNVGSTLAHENAHALADAMPDDEEKARMLEAYCKALLESPKTRVKSQKIWDAIKGDYPDGEAVEEFLAYTFNIMHAQKNAAEIIGKVLDGELKEYIFNNFLAPIYYGYKTATDLHTQVDPGYRREQRGRVSGRGRTAGDSGREAGGGADTGITAAEAAERTQISGAPKGESNNFITPIFNGTAQESSKPANQQGNSENDGGMAGLLRRGGDSAGSTQAERRAGGGSSAGGEIADGKAGGATEAAEPRQKSSRLEIEGAEKLSAERREAVECYAEGHYCVPIRVIADEADIRESGLSDVAVAQMMAALTEEGVPAVYCREDKKIYIFAGHKDSNVGSTLAHENFHALTDAIGDARENRYMLDEYRYLLLADLDHGEDFSRIWKAVADAYPPHKRAEEFVAYTVGLMYVSEGAAKAIRRILDGNAKSSIFQQLINPILYGTQTKTDAYRSANSENRRGGGAGVQQGRAGNSQAEGRADGEESAGGEVANEPRRRYVARKQATTTGMSLFDWADAEERERREVTTKDEKAIAAEEANAAIDGFVENYSRWLEHSVEIEAQLDAEGVEGELRDELAAQMESEEAGIAEERDKLEEKLRDYYALDNTPDDATKIAHDMVGRVQAEVEIRHRKEHILSDLLNGSDEAPIETTSDEVAAEEKTAEVKTGGGFISYNALGHLPDAKEGEFAYVERKFSRTGEFSFTGADKIRDRGDVAYLFRSLENYSVENVFAVLVKDGKARVLHIGMGTATSSLADMSAIRAGVDAFGADRIYLIHNHPSGTMVASQQDRNLMRTLEAAFGDKIDVSGIIIDTTSGRYVEFDGEGQAEVYDRPRQSDGDKMADVFHFDQADRSNMPEETMAIRSSSDVANAIGNLRFGEGKKVSYLILAHNGHVIGNFHTGYTDINASGLAEELASVASKYGGTSVVVYGNMPLDGVMRLKDAVARHSLGAVRLLDTLGVRNGIQMSAVDEGMLYEDGIPYGPAEVREPMVAARGREAFDALRDRVVAERGIVMPGLNEKVVRVVEVPRHDFAGNGKEALQAAEKWAKENIVGTHTALDSRGDEFGYTISGDAVEKYVSRSATGKSANIGVHLAALKKLPEIIKESIEAEVHPDYDKLNGIRNAENITNPETLIHRFYGAANVDGTIYRVKTTMREYRDKNRSPLAHSYEITQIELLEAPSDGVINNSGEPLAMTSNSSNVEPTVSPKDSGAPHRIANLLKGVEKSYDPGKKLLEESEKGEKTRGNLISYSTIDGETRQGILMGENFKLTDLRNSAPLSSRLAQIREGKAIVSENGDVQIEREMYDWRHRGEYELRVPKSKQRGGIYTMHPDLLKLVSGHNFITKGNNMVAYVAEADIAKVVDMLSRAPFNLTVVEESKLTDVSAEEAEDDVLCRPVTDKSTLDRLNSEPTIKVYRAMQMIDGGLRPPMSAKVDGELREATEVGVWEEAEEHPEMADENGRFKLDKGNGKSIKAAYNPYIHTSRSPINDQFSSAWSRPELVTVEVEIPASELTSEYHAEKAKDSVGEKEWKSGPVGRALAKIGQARKVILSRWSRVVRVVPVEEVADAYAQRLNAHGIEVPFNTVPPALRDALAERGVKIGKPEKGNAGAASMPAFEQWIAEQERQRMGDGYGAYSDAEISMANDPISKVMGKNRFSKKSQAEFAARERQRMANRIQELAERMHLDNVEKITDASQLEGKRAKAKGFYNKRTGKITIVIPNNVSTIDAEQTLLHEAVAHYGLRKLFGKRFDIFLDNVYESATEEIRRKIAEMAARNGWNFRTATEEYLAGLAENTDFEAIGRDASSQSWWAKVKQLFIDMVERVGFKGFRDKVGVTLTDNELRYILWRSYTNLTEPGATRSIFGEAADIAKQSELKVGNYAPAASDVAMASEATMVDAIGAVFDEQIGMYERGELKACHRFELGMPSRYLRSAGFPNLPISMRVTLLDTKAKMNRHPFEASDIKGLVEAMQKPIAIFEYTKSNMRNLIVDVKRGDKHFLVGVTLNYKAGDIEINSVSGLFPKDSVEWLKWIQDGKAIRIDQKEKVQQIIDSQRTTNTVESERIGLNLDDVAKIVSLFENPTIEEEDSLLFRSSGGARAEYDARVRTKEVDKKNLVSKGTNRTGQMAEAYLDSMRSLRILQEAVSHESGKSVQDYENAYMAENQMSSRNKIAEEVYTRDYFEPMCKAVAEVCKGKKEAYRQLLDYIIAKHGLERNAYMRSRAIANGVEQAEADATDYSGLTALTSEQDVAAAEVAAEKMVADYEAAHDVTELWQRINAATAETLRTRYQGGLLSKEVYEQIKSQYKYYIPLKGWAEETAADVYEYAAGGYGLGSALMSAYGRNSVADDPLATIMIDAQRTIMEANRNIMKQKFLNLALNHQIDLLSISRQWYVKQPDGTWIPDNPIIPEDADADMVDAIVKQHEAKMLALEAAGNAQTRRSGLRLGLVSKDADTTQHVVRVKRNGETFCIYVNGDPRAARAINGMLNPDAGEKTRLAEWAQNVKNFMSKAFTTWNPEFVVGNLSRDVMFAGVAVAVKEDGKYARNYTRNISSILAKASLPRLLYKWEHGTLDDSVEIERYFKEFLKNGGETGFTQLNTVEKAKRDMQRFLREAQGGASTMPKKAWRTFWNGVEFLNRSAEDTTRFAVYMTSRQQGRSVSRSINDAKEITVNFNKKGSGAWGARYFNFLYVFFNAAMQALANAGRLVYRNPGKASAAMGIFLSSGFLLPLVSSVLAGMCGDGDDDDYWNLPEWVRRNNLVFYIPFTKKYLTLPISHELRPFYGVGEIAYSVMCGKETVDDGIMKAIEGFSGILPIDYTGNGGDAVVNFSPTIAQPVVQISRNVDYFSKPIYKDTPWNKDDPEWAKAYKSTNGLLVDITRMMSEAGSSTDEYGVVEYPKHWYSGDINPAWIEHLLESYTGGVGKTLNGMGKTISMLWNEDARELRNVPVIRKFIQSSDERAEERRFSNEYFKHREEYEESKKYLHKLVNLDGEGADGVADRVNRWLDTDAGERYMLLDRYFKVLNRYQRVHDTVTEDSIRNSIQHDIDSIRHELVQKMDSINAGFNIQE